MRRILLLTSMAFMFAAAMALSGVAQAKSIGGSADAKCQQLAIRTLGPGFNPADYTFVGGTEGNDDFSEQAYQGTSPEVFCGFGGDDYIFGLQEGDIFLGGLGNDSVHTNNGTFYGADGNDSVYDTNFNGTFNGGVGVDYIVEMMGGTFDGGDDTDDDYVVDYIGGRLVNVP